MLIEFISFISVSPLKVEKSVSTKKKNTHERTKGSMNSKKK